MAFNIFQFDWIFIDTVVIILLIVFLISVKIFKERFRWRSTLSNIALDQNVYDTQNLDLTNQNLIVKHLSITINNNLNRQVNIRPLIIIFKTIKNNKLIQVITEGLATYGFDVLTLTLFIKSLSNSDSRENQLQEEFLHLITSILSFFRQKKVITNSNYLTIHYKPKISYGSIIHDNKNLGMILINPKFEIFAQKNIYKVIEKKELFSKFFLIFNKKSSNFLTSKKFLTNLADYDIFNTRLSILGKSSFKNYETLLLGEIINVIESIKLKYHVLS